MVESRVKQLRDLLEDAIANGDQDQIEIIQQELFTINPTYVKGYLKVVLLKVQQKVP
jgi:hypothetical protein